MATVAFGFQKNVPAEEAWNSPVNTGTNDAYRLLMYMDSLKNVGQYYGEDNSFWQELKENPDYNEIWQKISINPHLKKIKPAIMVVGDSLMKRIYMVR